MYLRTCFMVIIVINEIGYQLYRKCLGLHFEISCHNARQLAPLYITVQSINILYIVRCQMSRCINSVLPIARPIL